MKFKNIIEIKDLTLVINNITLFKNFNLDICPGKRVGLTGPSGCGKSTLLKSLISSNFPAGSNSKQFSIEPISKDFKVGYLPQSSGLLPWFSLKKNLSLYSQDLILINEIVAALDLSDSIDLFPHNLSGGEQQRATLACNMILKPNLYISDEPLTEIDLPLKWNVLKVWSKYIKQHNSTLLLVSHDIDILLYMCDEIITLSNKPSIILKQLKINEYTHPRDKENIVENNYIKYRQYLTA